MKTTDRPSRRVRAQSAAAPAAQPSPPQVVSLKTLDELDDITRWLGTFGTRLNAVRQEERPVEIA